MRLAHHAAVLVLAFASYGLGAETPKATISGLKNPESVCYGPGGHIYVTEIGERGKNGDGKVIVIENGKARTFAEGLDDPRGMVFYRDSLFVTDNTKIVRVSAEGKPSVYLAADKFPRPPLYLNDIAVDAPKDVLVVSDSGDRQGMGGAAYRINAQNKKVEIVADTSLLPGLHTPNGVAFDGSTHILLADMATGILHRVNMATRKNEKVAEGMDGADGLIWDYHGRLFITSWRTGKVFAIPRPGQKPILIGEGLQSAADGCLAANGKELLIPDMKSGTLTTLSTTIPGWEVDESTPAVEWRPAFTKLKFTGWDSGAESGQIIPLRPIVLTHAGDGSSRVFVAIQQGTIHFFENQDDATETKVFLDITKKVRYLDNQNEEGLLGLAFHPKFKENGEFFVFYTDVKARMTNVISRFRVKKDDPNSADPASEEELLRIDRPFWNHDGGTIVFGPDGYLYIMLGDGGAANDPYRNGQNLKAKLGKVLRIDVDKKANGKNYAIPPDNPFLNHAGAAPEIWAYGIRNVWRMAFDRKTGWLWAGEVGQDLYEEINILTAGGNFGWNIRESLHPFGREGVDVRPDLIDPIWEYHHDIGKSITGGHVYRGKQIPELDGAYLYADYVSTRVWALRYDAEKKRVVANHVIKSPNVAVLSFGEDDKGEAYILGASATGKGIYRLEKSDAR